MLWATAGKLLAAVEGRGPTSSTPSLWGAQLVWEGDRVPEGRYCPGFCRRCRPDVPGLARGVQRGVAGAAAGEGPPEPGQGRLPRHRGHQRQGHEVRRLAPLGNPKSMAVA